MVRIEVEGLVKNKEYKRVGGRWITTFVTLPFRKMNREVLLVIASCLIALAGVELTARAFVHPSDGSAGVLMDRRLPPFKIVPANPPKHDPHARDSVWGGIVVDGKRITAGDLSGYRRPDDFLGFTTQENTVSVNGWWQSNNIGARARSDTALKIPAGKKRTLVFGESFAESVHIRQEDAWTNILASLEPRREVVNLAVSAYSMGQAYLRYLTLKDVLEHSGTLMMFVPGADLWRDVNTIRDLYTPWNMPVILPRFVVDGGKLRLVSSPYSNLSDIYSENHNGLSVRLRDHLRVYDRYYFKSLYEDLPIIGHLITYKLAALAVGQFAREAVDRRLMAPGSEALEVSRAIFLAMQADEAKLGAKFGLLILPTEFELKDSFNDSFGKWRAMVDYICSGLRHCMDLAPELLKIPQHDRDRGYDGGHHGPIVNRHIAEAVHSELTRRGL
jgi:hypothetical protein